MNFWKKEIMIPLNWAYHAKSIWISMIVWFSRYLQVNSTLSAYHSTTNLVSRCVSYELRVYHPSCVIYDQSTIFSDQKLDSWPSYVQIVDVSVMLLQKLNTDAWPRAIHYHLQGGHTLYRHPETFGRLYRWLCVNLWTKWGLKPWSAEDASTITHQNCDECKKVSQSVHHASLQSRQYQAHSVHSAEESHHM